MFNTIWINQNGTSFINIPTDQKLAKLLEEKWLNGLSHNKLQTRCYSIVSLLLVVTSVSTMLVSLFLGITLCTPCLPDMIWLIRAWVGIVSTR